MSLKKHGIQSEIFEVRQPSYYKGGNIALAPNALRVLDHIGIYDRIRTQGFNYEGLAFSNGSGQMLGMFLNGSQKIYNYSALRIHRSIVRSTLAEELERQGIPIKYDKKCLGIKSESEKSAIVEFESGEIVEAQFVIGCDGIHSQIRPFFAPNTTPSFSGLMGVMGCVDESNLESLKNGKGLHLPNMLFGSNGSFAIMPSSFDGKEIGYFATIQEQDKGRDGWAHLDNAKAGLHTMLDDRFLPEKFAWPELVKELCKKTPEDTLTSWPFFSVPHLDTWASPKKRVIVIGDAAHAIPPTGGQGAAQAFEDAETLGYVLSRVFATDFSFDKLPEIITKWEQHRFARIAKVIDFTTKNGDIRKSSNHFYEQAAKEWLIWAMFKFMGPEGGAQWMYSYNAESVLSALV